MWNSFLSSTCRVCLSKTSVDSVLFESKVFFDGPDELKNISIKDCFLDITTIQINISEAQNTKLCIKCLIRLQEAYQFRIDSIAANDHLNRNDSNFLRSSENSDPDEDPLVESDAYIKIIGEEDVPEALMRLEENKLRPQEERLVNVCQYSDCQKHFEKKSHYKAHYLKNHMSKEAIVSCTACTFVTDVIHMMYKHIDSSHNSTAFSCAFCPKITFETSILYQNHLKYFHPPSIKNNLEYSEPDNEETSTKQKKLDKVESYNSDEDKRVKSDSIKLEDVELEKFSHNNEESDQESTSSEESESSSNNENKNSKKASTSNKFSCKLCGSCFKSRNGYQKHKQQKTCENSKEFPDPEDKLDERGNLKKVCTTCGRFFKNVQGYRIHFFTVHIKGTGSLQSVGDFSCDKCQKKFNYRNALRYHEQHLPCQKTKFKYDEVIDNLIKKKRESIPQSSEVLDEITQTIKSSCPACAKLFVTPSTYKIHYTYQHLKIEEIENVGESSNIKTENDDADNEIYLEDGIPSCKRVLCKKTKRIKMQCKVCKKLLGAYSAYKLHYINKHLLATNIPLKKSEKPEPILEGEQLFEEIHLNCPEEIKWRRKSYRCLKCNDEETYKGELNLIKHFKLVHRIDRIYSCIKCFKRFKSLFQLNLHLSLPICPAYVEGKRQPNNDGSELQPDKWREYTIAVMCEDCKTCSSAVSYRTHMMEIHNIDRGFLCDMCDHRSKAVDSLFNHMLVHDKTAKFQCEQCGHSLRSIKALKFHVLSAHKTEGKLLCAHCPNTFVSKYLIDSHIKIKHLGIKPATCKLCQVEFGTGGACRDHVAASHLKFLVSCQLCGIKVGTKLRLKYHYGKFHKDDARYKEVIEDYRKIKMPNVEQYIQYNVKFFDKS